MKSQYSRWLLWIEVVLLAVMAPLFIFSRIDRIWPFAIFPILWAFRYWIAKKDVKRFRWPATPLDAAVLLLVLQIFMSSIAAGEWGSMLPKIAGIIYGILVFYALVRLLRTNRLVCLGISVFVLGGAALAFIGISGMMSTAGEPHFRKVFGPLFEKIPRMSWNFPGAESGLNPNAIAGSLVLFIPLCIFLAWSWSKKKIIIAAACGLLSIVFILVIFLTQTIASWLALGVGIWLVLPKGTFKIIAAIAAVLFAFVILILLPEADIEAAAKRNIPYWQQKVEDRHRRWAVGIDAVRKNPLSGVGINMLRFRPELGYGGSHAHNHMLHTAAELGIPGLVAYLAVLGGAFGMSRFTWHRAKPAWMRASARGLAGGQAAHFVFGLGDSIPLGAKPGLFFWVSLALIAMLYELANKQILHTVDASKETEKEKTYKQAGLFGFLIKKPCLPIIVAVFGGGAIVAFLINSRYTANDINPDLGAHPILYDHSRVKVISEPLGETEDVRAQRLITEKPRITWRSRMGDSPPFVFVFALTADYCIRRLDFLNSGNEAKTPGIGANNVEVEFSMSGPDDGYYRGGSFNLEKGDETQVFRIDCNKARWIRLTIHSNNGHPDFTELNMVVAWGRIHFHTYLLIAYFIWIVGAAIVLAAFGWHQRLARRANLSLREALRLPTFTNAAKVGAILIAAGVLASAVGESARVPVLAALASIGIVAAAVFCFKSWTTKSTL